MTTSTMDRKLDDALLLRLRVEDLLYHEADLIDRWQLEEWFALFTEDAHYYVPPSDVDGDTADPETSLFYIVDDHVRLRERIVRLGKIGAHSEHPRSKLRHLVTNVRAHRDGDIIHSRASFIVSRAKDITHDLFVGHYLHELVERDGQLKIQKKTCVLDMEALRPHARISILL
ncbi:MAG: aromatic-ring-hydroxylating dioxygenase subunit beta [Novosphingobium sp.]|nr:aromatic-ring-hydroxylating dioxygenase subunit beta [Novosphingobium sp.]